MNKDPIVTKIKFNEKEKEELNLLAKGEMLPIVKTRIDKFGNSHEYSLPKTIHIFRSKNETKGTYGGGFCTTCRVLPDL